jgi:hypothetical protein
LILLLDNETESLPKFISAQKLLEDKFILEFSNNNDDNKNKTTKVKKRRTELTIGGKIELVLLNLIQILFVILSSEVYCRRDIID